MKFFLQPTQKLKTNDQVNAEERKKLLQLENERAERMKRQRESEDEEEEKPVMLEFRSADSLDDGYIHKTLFTIVVNLAS